MVKGGIDRQVIEFRLRPNDFGRCRSLLCCCFFIASFFHHLFFQFIKLLLFLFYLFLLFTHTRILFHQFPWFLNLLQALLFILFSSLFKSSYFFFFSCFCITNLPELIYLFFLSKTFNLQFSLLTNMSPIFFAVAFFVLLLFFWLGLIWSLFQFFLILFVFNAIFYLLLELLFFLFLLNFLHQFAGIIYFLRRIDLFNFLRLWFLHIILSVLAFLCFYLILKIFLFPFWTVKIRFAV